MIKIFDGEFFKDCTVLVFKQYNEKQYDVFVSCKIKFDSLTIPKCNIFKIKELKSYLEGKALVGFNNQTFDNQIITKITKGVTNPEDIYEYSQGIISNPNRNYREYYDNKLAFRYIDLYKLNHYDNPARATSLKKLEFNYRRKKILDLPFHHTKCVTKLVELEDIVRYCIEDVEVTEECYNNSLEAINLRKSLSDKYGRNMLNMSDSLLGEEISLINYCNKTGHSESYIRKNKPAFEEINIKFSDCIPEYIEFETYALKEFLIKLKEKTVTSTKEFSEKLTFGNNIFSFGQGGIHTEDPPRIIVSNDNYILKDADLTSMYPVEIIKRKLHPRHLNYVWSQNLLETYTDRVTKYKPFAKKDPKAMILSEACKIIMNSTYGKTNSAFSWQFDPLVTMKVTIGGQLMIMMLVEKLHLNNIMVVSCNTDGILCYLRKDQYELYNSICKQWEIQVGNNEMGSLEFTEYDFIAQLSVNDYIAKVVNGDIKRKGSFLTYDDIQKNQWHKDSSAMIIPFAIQEYFVNKIPIEKTILECNDIFEFCYGSKKQKAAKKGAFKWLISEITENNIINSYLSEDRFMRYYIGGNTTINKLYDDGSITNLSTKNNPVTTAQYLRRKEIVKNDVNAYPELNKNFYINEALEQIALMKTNIINL